MTVSLRQIETAFFEAMSAGWSENAQKETIQEMPGSKVIPFEWGDFRVMDCYFVDPHSDKSTGSTTIWHCESPIWVMYYGGWYYKSAIPFLKQCLTRAYVDERRFYGGRGPHFVQDGRFTYHNKIESGNFTDFWGEESIHDTSEQRFGFHWYRGMSLLKH